MVVIIWEFRIRPERRAEFERHYGPGGTWVEFFQRDAAYRGTTLLRDTHDPDLYLTLDDWENAAAYQAFRVTHAERYTEIDRECETLTVGERKLGEYEKM